MHGNVFEWVEDCWNKTYASAPTDGSAWTTGDCNQHIPRGGGWSTIVRGLSSASRSRTKTVRAKNFGFRVVRTLTP